MLCYSLTYSKVKCQTRALSRSMQGNVSCLPSPATCRRTLYAKPITHQPSPYGTAQQASAANRLSAPIPRQRYHRSTSTPCMSPSYFFDNATAEPFQKVLGIDSYNFGGRDRICMVGCCKSRMSRYLVLLYGSDQGNTADWKPLEAPLCSAHLMRVSRVERMSHSIAIAILRRQQSRVLIVSGPERRGR
ncbi:hypothetical protein BDV95DRAFT_115594 [Massariosphaeria phaeospora]|uniref:Uncharacterized protein n=1 Tax=Massariosphaeria phaeospora TaxID=100035 RepID=A0A7C8I6A6_9PLEO|nr:hypothetical protein BDV95DRAFT_115594 [Massariosphaeria phaeospora]